MSEIVELIISYVIAYLLALGISLLVAYIQMRKLEKHVHDSIRELRENRAALDKSLDESHARSQSLDEASVQVDEIHQSFDEMHEDMDEIHQSLDSISESLDRMNESMDRTIEFKRLMRDYSNYKIKMIEARENFHEPEFSDEKNIH